MKRWPAAGLRSANLSEDVRRTHPDAPVVHVDPTTFSDAMRTLVANVDERRRLAALGRPFVADVHDADRIAVRLVEAYAGPGAAVRERAMPDWMSYGRQRRIEQLESRVARLETDLARARHREEILRDRLGIARDVDIEDWARLRAIGRRVLPARLRARLRRGRPPGEGR